MIEKVKTPEQLIPGAKDREIAEQQVTDLNLSGQLSHAEAIALIIEDNRSKAMALKYELPEPVAAIRSSSATGGIALFQALVAHEVPEDTTLPPIVIFMDGRLPAKASPLSGAESGMGLRTAKEIVRFCRENRVIIPRFVGFSGDTQPNEDLRALLEENGLDESYAGDFFVSSSRVFTRLGALGLAGFNNED